MGKIAEVGSEPLILWVSLISSHKSCSLDRDKKLCQHRDSNSGYSYLNHHTSWALLVPSESGCLTKEQSNFEPYGVLWVSQSSKFVIWTSIDSHRGHCRET